MKTAMHGFMHVNNTIVIYEREVYYSDITVYEKAAYDFMNMLKIML